jgi:XTP/dITP diphosphohydrolase
MNILLATTNPGKLAELKTGLSGLVKIGFNFKTLNDLNITKDVEETGKTFKENAELKAKFFAEIAGMATIADDGGFTISALNGEPGVHSKRWLGREATDEELIQFTLAKLNNVPSKNRQAALQTCICFFDPQSGQLLFEIEKVEGVVANKPSKMRIKGFPYRSLLIVSKFNKYYDDLNESEHALVNHRFIALRRLSTKIKQLYEK